MLWLVCGCFKGCGFVRVCVVGVLRDVCSVRVCVMAGLWVF